MRVLVTGATGYVGSRLVPRLLDAGHEVVAGSRRLPSLTRFDWSDFVKPVELDAMDLESCRRAVAGCDTVYYLVHGLGEGDFETSDRLAATNTARAAREAQVGRIVYLGGFVPDGESLSDHLDSRAEVGEVLGASGVPLVWLRAAIVLGAGSTSFEVVRYAVERLPVVPAPSWMDSLVQPIAVDDLLYYLVAAADDSLPPGSYDVGGDERMPYRDLISRYAHVAGLRRPILRVPFVSTGLASALLGRLTPVPTDLTVDLVDSLNNTMIGEEDRIRRLVPDPPGGLTGLDEAIARSLAGRDTRGVSATEDPLQLTDTDAGWAGGDVYRGHYEQDVAAPAPAVWRLIETIGGSQGWSSWPRVWQLGGLVDHLLGGPGRTSTRRDPDQLSVGDRIDQFVVDRVTEGFSVRLVTGPHLPGSGTLDLVVDPTDEDSCRVRLDVAWAPSGLRGHALWWSGWPWHRLLFTELLRRLAGNARRR